MLQIRTDQMKELLRAAVAAANRDLCLYARARFADHFEEMPQEKLLAFVSDIRDEARAYGIVNENDVATALDLTVMYGADFYTEEWAADIFSLPNLSGDRKMEMLRWRVKSVGIDL